MDTGIYGEQQPEMAFAHNGCNFRQNGQAGGSTADDTDNSQGGRSSAALGSIRDFAAWGRKDEQTSESNSGAGPSAGPGIRGGATRSRSYISDRHIMVPGKASHRSPERMALAYCTRLEQRTIEGRGSHIVLSPSEAMVDIPQLPRDTRRRHI